VGGALRLQRCGVSAVQRSERKIIVILTALAYFDSFVRLGFLGTGTCDPFLADLQEGWNVSIPLLVDVCTARQSGHFVRFGLLAMEPGYSLAKSTRLSFQ
jgi:hypothetical protein